MSDVSLNKVVKSQVIRFIAAGVVELYPAQRAMDFATLFWEEFCKDSINTSDQNSIEIHMSAAMLYTESLRHKNKQDSISVVRRFFKVINRPE